MNGGAFALLECIGLNPYPQIEHAGKPGKMLFDPNKQDMVFVKQVLDAFPTMAEASGSRKQMVSAFATRDEAALPLLQWIVRT